MTTTQMTLAQAIRKHLSLNGEGAAAILAGIRALTPRDRADLVEAFQREFGYTIQSAS